MKKLLIYTFVIVFSSISKAQLYFKNSTEEPVAVAIAKWVSKDGSGNWYTIGWTKVDPGDNVLVLNGIGTAGYCYYYAEANVGKKFEGNISFLVDRNNGSMSIKNSDKQYQKDSNPNFVWTKFRKFEYETDFLGDTKVKQTIVLEY